MDTPAPEFSRVCDLVPPDHARVVARDDLPEHAWQTMARHGYPTDRFLAIRVGSGGLWLNLEGSEWWDRFHAAADGRPVMAFDGAIGVFTAPSDQA